MLLRKDLSKTQETLKSFFRVFSKGFSWFCICLTIRGLVIFEFSSLGPKSPFLLFWQMKTMARRWRKYDIFLSSEWWAMSGEFWVMRGRDVCVQRPKFLLTQIAQISPKGLDIRHFERWAVSNEQWVVNDERERLEDVDMNSRGLLSPRFLTSAQYWRLQRRESATWIHQTIYIHR